MQPQAHCSLVLSVCLFPIVQSATVQPAEQDVIVRACLSAPLALCLAQEVQMSPMPTNKSGQFNVVHATSNPMQLYVCWWLRLRHTCGVLASLLEAKQHIRDVPCAAQMAMKLGLAHNCSRAAGPAGIG